MLFRSTLQFLILTILSSGVYAGPIPGKSIRYVTVTAGKGQGIFSLLREYNLLDADNLKLFSQLNNLNKDAELEKGKKYKLPVKIHDFDGKSIRSTMGLKDLQKARQIENYNKSLAQTKIKKQSFKQDNKLWVPVILSDRRSIAESLNQKTALIKPVNARPESMDSEDPRKKILTASLPVMKSSLVAERRLTAAELNTQYLKNQNANLTSNLAFKVSSKSLKIPLFGLKHELVSSVSRELMNEVFYIIPGHGGPDPGAMAKNVDGEYTICEDEYAYDVSLRLAKNLIERGATVYVIVQDKNDGIRDEKYLDCDCDEVSLGGYEIPLKQKKRLKQGISKVNKLFAKHKKQGIKKQWMISLHIDAQSEESRQDVFFYYQSESEPSKKKALDIQKVFEEKYQMYRSSQEYNGTVTSRPLYVVRHSDPEPIFIELANIHNPQDRQRILIPKNRQLLADWITEGFIP